MTRSPPPWAHTLEPANPRPPYVTGSREESRQLGYDRTARGPRRARTGTESTGERPDDRHPRHRPSESGRIFRVLRKVHRAARGRGRPLLTAGSIRRHAGAPAAAGRSPVPAPLRGREVEREG